ncbi:oleate-activated transcription factor 1 [Fusarium bulbicola]|nr:oleate-activated transcription factor 1 [Fusarium bulbicola]
MSNQPSQELTGTLKRIDEKFDVLTAFAQHDDGHRQAPTTDLASSPGNRRHILLDEEAPHFLVICGKMLDTGAKAGSLGDEDELAGEFVREVGIFAVGFQVAAAAWCSGNTNGKKSKTGDTERARS